jgi:hypothetical protein
MGFLCLKIAVEELAPVAFDEHIASTAMYPVMGHPMCMAVRRTIPSARRPDIAVAIPAMIAINPFIFGTGAWAASFDDGGRRSYTDHDLCKRGRR